MPTTQSLPTPDLYFTSLQGLDDYRAKKLSDRPSSNRTTPWTPRKTSAQGTKGKLLVCHDYKGGYVENPQGLSYTFNYWSLCDTFVYFSHNRVTIPPPGWVNAAHRQGVKMLGVLVFEGGAEAECLRLIVGQLPHSSTGTAVQSFTPSTLPISPHYAIALAELAAERGFDGYLLNFECYLQGGLEQARALAAWIDLLESELVKRVGAHAEVSWYDSVIFNGSLSWQNRLNSWNLPFFIPSTSFFSNYSWPPDFIEQTTAYFLSVNSNVLGLATETKPKSLQDVYMGVDVWGRGSYGGGGFGSYKAITHVAPLSLGLSVALFAQAWTWETQQDNPGWNWDQWWQYERDLWVGNPDPNAVMPVPPNWGDSEGPYKPLSSFFVHLPPPDPLDVPFHTTFCPGVGMTWFVEGSPVYQFASGWMDVDKQTAMGDLLWPAPALKSEGDSAGTLPDVAVSANMADSWNSGSSIKLDFSGKAAPNTGSRSFYVPVQTLSITTQKSYTASVIYKATQSTGDLDLRDVSLSVRPRNTTTTSTTAEVKLTPQSVKSTAISNNWTKVTIQFTITDTPPSNISVDSEIGLIISTISNDTTVPFSLTLLLGQLNVYGTPSSTIDPNFPRVLWADFSNTTTTTTGTQELTTITWIPSTSLSQVGPITITSPDDPTSAWTPQPPQENQWFPGFLYYNIYAAEPGAAIRALAKARSPSGQRSLKFLSVSGDAQEEAGMGWVGTSGADGSIGKGKLEFTFDRAQLPDELKNLTTLRVFVQGVLDTGEVLSWENCVYVDVQY
ncbi:Cytosolic endo-beta-N-acetylglucosaminidase [Leucoagaricus sp. SymC.cos]|nr:Cytosolic endo-beta-N-acetylglucosaminidase [Leucoagaricus sp. SymC.cos]